MGSRGRTSRSARRARSTERPHSATARTSRSATSAAAICSPRPATGAAWQVSGRDGQYKNFLRGLAFGNGTFLGIGGDPGAVGSSAPFVALSEDGVKWTDYLPIPGKH